MYGKQEKRDQNVSVWKSALNLDANFSSKKILAALFVSVTAWACQPATQSQTSAIIGADDRANLDNDESIAKNVGFLMTPEGPCTAFLTAQNEITTAAHCFNPSIKDLRAYLFVVPSAKKESFVERYAKEKSSDAEARLILKDSFETYLEKGEFNPSIPTSIVSFSFDGYQLLTHKNCTSQVDTRYGFLTHECDTLPGASGSPILQDGKVVGIHQGYSKNIGKNTATVLGSEGVSEQSFADLLRQTDQLEVSCGTNCSKHCRRRVGGYSVPNPICEGTCNLERGIQCGAESARNGVVARVLSDIGGIANRDAWTRSTCRQVGTPPILLAAGIYVGPVCSAAGLATAGWGVPACVASVTGVIVEAVCTQLCVDKHLSDCK